MSKSKSTADRRNKLFALVFIVLALCTLGVRLPQMEKRPFHCDESVQAVKFGSLLEEGAYHYNPVEYHGPSLYYLSLPVAWVQGATELADLNEFDLRLLPLVFGVGVVLLLALLRNAVGDGPTLLAAAFTALSPFMVYFSRYYIQEMLLVFFTLGAMGCGWRYYCRPKMSWAIFTGVCLGMMFATKETCIIAWFSMGVALLLTARKRIVELKDIPAVHILSAIASALIVAGLFFSSFGTYPEGIVKAVTAFTHYFGRTEGEGHAHPWYYYFKWLFWYREQGVFWTEIAILIPAVYGVVRALIKRATMPSFLAYYTVAMLLVYSLIPYKTPWLALGFLQPMIILSGYGGAKLFIDIRGRFYRFALAGLLLFGVANLAYQTWWSSFYFAADERNPCAYSHTSTDMIRISEQLHRIAESSGEGKDLLIKIIAPEYWPFPWYLRDFEHVGYWHEVPDNPRAPVIITSPQIAEEVEGRLDEEYFQTLAGIRPGVVVCARIRRDYWDAYLDEMNDVRK